MKNLKFYALIMTIAFLNIQLYSQLASWSDAQGGYSLNFMEIASDVPHPCDPTGPCFTNCPSFVVSTCDTIFLKFQVSISTINSTSVFADFTIQYRPIGGLTSWLNVLDDEIIGFCSIDKPQFNCCTKTYTYGVPINNSYEYRVIIDPQWSSASGSTTFYNVDFYRPEVDLSFNLLNTSSQTTNPTEPEIVCLDDDMILEVSPEFAQYLASFHNDYFGNDFILVIHKTDEDGIILDSEIIDNFDLEADYWTGSGFDLNELTDDWFESTGFYLINLFDDGSSCYTDNDNYLWVELVDVFDIKLKYSTGGSSSGDVILSNTNTSFEEPIVGCFFSPSFDIVTFNNTGELYSFDVEIIKYDEFGEEDYVALPFLGLSHRPQPDPNTISINLNGEILEHGDFNDLIMNNQGIYKISVKFENICGVTEYEYWYDAFAPCKTNWTEGLIKNIEIFPNPVHVRNNLINIKITTDDQMNKLTLKMYNINGQFIKHEDYKIAKGENSLQFRFSQPLSKGLYFLTLEGLQDSEFETFPILIE